MSDRRPYRRHGRKSQDDESGGKSRRRRGKGGIIAFLLASLVPVAGIAVYVLLPQETKDLLAEKIRGDVVGRAIAAAIGFAVMFVLARVALPAFHNASKPLRMALFKLRGLKPALRILAFPASLLVWLAWFLFQMLFAMDAFLILVAGFVGLLLAVRIVMPDFLPGILPDLVEKP